MSRSNRKGKWNICLPLLIACALAAPLRLGADEKPPAPGEFLVATPEMGDPRFAETVIYLVRRDASGDMGLVINRPIARGPIGDLLKGFAMETEGARGEIVLHFGGPVEPNRAFVLHSDDYLVDGSTVVKDGVAVTANLEMLRAMSLGKGPRQTLFALGYAGWAPGQLEAEIKAGAWFTVPAEKAMIFGGENEKKWRQAADRRKIEL